MIKRPETTHMPEQGSANHRENTPEAERDLSQVGFPREDYFIERQAPIHTSEDERIWNESEYEFVDTAGITISSSPGGGSSALSRILAERLGVSNVKHIGELRRIAEWNRKGTMHIEDMQRDDPKIERQTDLVTSRELRTATDKTPVIIEAQLGGIISKFTEERQKKNHKAMGRVAKILLTVDPLEGARRVRSREEGKARKEIEERQANGKPIEASLLARLNRSDEYWAEVNSTRHAKDLRNWRQAYPQLRGIDPHDTNALEKDGKTPIWKRYYDFKLDTTFANLDEVCSQIIISLLENGYIRRKELKIRELKQEQAEKTPGYFHELSEGNDWIVFEGDQTKGVLASDLETMKTEVDNSF